MLRFFTQLFGKKMSSAPKTVSSALRTQVRLHLEELTSRDLPNAGPMGMFLGQFANHHGHRVNLASQAEVSHAHENSSSESFTEQTHSCHGGESNAGATLSASLSNESGATGTSSFNATSGVLSIQIQGAAASSSLDIAIDGTTVGTLTTDESGNGQLTIDDTETSLQSGSTITIGDLTGTFTQTKFTASLTGAEAATGHAQFNTLKNSLTLAFNGAAANTTYNVLVNDVVVGQVTTNSKGRGRFHLTSTKIAIQAGSTISVQDTSSSDPILLGTFA
jgi:hypothetical protein